MAAQEFHQIGMHAIQLHFKIIVLIDRNTVTLPTAILRRAIRAAKLFRFD